MTRKINSAYSEAGKWILTADALSKIVPGGELLCHFKDTWSEWDKDYKIPEIKDCIRREFSEWIDSASDGEIIVLRFELETNANAALRKLDSIIIGTNKRWYVCKGLPTIMARPQVVFYPISKRAGGIVELKRGLRRTYGDTTITIRNVVPQSKDFKTIFALISIMKNDPEAIVVQNNVVNFNTSYSEIARTMKLNNPYANSARDGIRNSFQRLTDTSILWSSISENRVCEKMSHILLEVDSLDINNGDANIEIDFNLSFFRLYGQGYLNVDEGIFYSLRDQEINIYLYLLGQAKFNRMKKGGEYSDDLFKLYKCANLEGLAKESKPLFTKRMEIKKSLEGLEQAGAIKEFQIKDDIVKIFTKGGY